MPSSSSGFEGEPYQDVVDDLEEAGFTNVQSRPMADLITGWLNKEYSVDRVKVGSETKFGKNSRFPSETKILVYYHSFPEDEEEIPEATPTEDPSESESAEPKPVMPPPVILDEIYAAQFLALAWENRMTYGGTVHWIVDRITTANADGTFTFKIGATIKNEYGTKFRGTIEGTVGGTNDEPTILDSILYTDTGETLNYYD